VKSIVFLVLFLIHSAVNSAPLSTEDIFSQAEKYTLELVTEIKIPFVEDKAGSFKGTGFLIDKERGWVLTNAHVAGRSLSIIRGRFKDTRYHKLKKVYMDPVIDLAVLQIDPLNIPNNALEARLDCESEPRAGHPIGAYGHPWGLSFNAARGIVSGITYLQDDEWLQVDAPINSGNSGGALLSLESGLVVGINSAGFDDADGLNFALPIRHVCTVIKLLQNNKNPSPPDFGISYFQSNEKNELKVADVFGNCNLQSGDIIKSISGADIYHKFDFINILRGKEEVKVLVVRKGKEEEVTLKIKPSLSVVGAKGIYFSGMLITPNNLLDRKNNNFSNTWIINSVKDGTPAQSHELEAWDYITSIDDQVFSDVEHLYSYLNTEKNNDVSLVVKRISESNSRYYDYHEVDIHINDLRVIEIN
jgi:serine protease Do/serine protease DegQ